MSIVARTGTLHALRILWGFKDKVAEGVVTDVRHRYAGSLLGMGWSIAFPVIQMMIYAVVYVFIFRVRPPGMDQYQYVLMVFSGLVPLMAFNEAVNAGAASLTSNRSLLVSTVFPPELIPVRAVLSAQVPSLLGFVLVGVITAAFGTASLWALLWAPLLWVLLVAFALGLSWVLSLMSLIVRDVQQVLPLVMMTLMILSPFAYTPEMVPPALKALLYANPLSYFVLGFQQLLSFGRFPDLLPLVVSLFLGLATFVAGFSFFRSAKHVFFDYA